MAILQVIAVCLLATTCLAATHRVKRQAEFTCPQADGTFPDPANCAKFFQCTNNQGNSMDCAPTLLFNPNTGTCDWPNIVRDMNPGCQDLGTPDSAHAVCNNIPAGLTPGWAFKVQAPNLCNAFFTCGAGFLFAPCLFCGEMMYFDSVLGQCVSLDGASSADVCNGMPFVEHKDKVFKQLDGTCWPFLGVPNPMQELADKIAREGGNNNNNNNQGNSGGNNNNYNRG